MRTGDCSTRSILGTLKWLPQKSHRGVSMCVLHLHDKRCSLGIHESLGVSVTSFTLRSPCSWKLPCEMYVLQFYLNFFSVVLAQLRLTLHCRCIDASTSTPPHLSTFTSSHARIRRSTCPPHYTQTFAHLYRICTTTLSLLHICPVFLSTYLFSLSIYVFARSHPYIYLSTSIHLHIYMTPAHPHCHSFTSHTGQSHVSLSGHPSSSLHILWISTIFICLRFGLSLLSDLWKR